MLARAYLLIPILLSLSIAEPTAAAPAMFEASFIFHAWGSDISSGATSPYASNNWTAAPLGYNCQFWEFQHRENRIIESCATTNQQKYSSKLLNNSHLQPG